MMNEESLKNWEQDNIELLTSREMGEWLHRRDMNTRPQGEWEYKEIANSTIIGYWCSCCHIGSQREYNFCPNCGADMRGEKK